MDKEGAHVGETDEERVVERRGRERDGAVEERREDFEVRMVEKKYWECIGKEHGRELKKVEEGREGSAMKGETCRLGGKIEECRVAEGRKGSVVERRERKRVLQREDMEECRESAWGRSVQRKGREKCCRGRKRSMVGGREEGKSAGLILTGRRGAGRQKGGRYEERGGRKRKKWSEEGR